MQQLKEKTLYFMLILSVFFTVLYLEPHQVYDSFWRASEQGASSGALLFPTLHSNLEASTIGVRNTSDVIAHQRLVLRESCDKRIERVLGVCFFFLFGMVAYRQFFTALLTILGEKPHFGEFIVLFIHHSDGKKRAS